MRTSASPARLLTPALLGGVSGLALQLRQDRLWDAGDYSLLCALALAGVLLLRRLGAGLPRLTLAFVVAALLAHASTGLRAVLLLQTALDPALEGRDLDVTGRISAMPQFGDNSTRLRFQVESATLDGQAVEVPPRLALSW